MVRPDLVDLGRQSVPRGPDLRPGPGLHFDLDLHRGPDRLTGLWHLAVPAVLEVPLVRELPLE